MTTKPKINTGMESLGDILQQFINPLGVVVPDWAMCELPSDLQDPARPDHGRTHFKTELTHPLWKFWIFMVIETTPFTPWFRAKIYRWGVFEDEIVKKAKGIMGTYAQEHGGQTFRCECPGEIDGAITRSADRYKRRLNAVGLPNAEKVKTLANFEKRKPEQDPTGSAAHMLTAAHTFIKEQGHRTLILLGPPGTGKSHVGMAVVYDAMDRGESCRFIGWGELRELMLSTFQRDNSYSEGVERPTVWDLLNQYADYKWLVIDDLGNGAALTPWATEQLRTLLDKRLNDQDKRTIITTNLTEDRFEPQLGHPVASRLTGNNQRNEETPLQIVVVAQDYRKELNK